MLYLYISKGYCEIYFHIFQLSDMKSINAPKQLAFNIASNMPSRICFLPLAMFTCALSMWEEIADFETDFNLSLILLEF